MVAGRALDNAFERLWRTVKYEHIYLHDHVSLGALRRGLKASSTITISSVRNNPFAIELRRKSSSDRPETRKMTLFNWGLPPNRGILSLSGQNALWPAPESALRSHSYVPVPSTQVLTIYTNAAFLANAGVHSRPSHLRNARNCPTNGGHLT
jgi:hypothetical protein